MRYLLGRFFYGLFFLFPSFLFSHAVVPELSNPFPVDLLSGRVVITSGHSISVGPEEITINRDYISPKENEVGRWRVMEHIFVQQSYLKENKGYWIHDAKGSCELFLPEDKSFIRFKDEIILYEKKEDRLAVSFSSGCYREFEKIKQPWINRSYRLVEERTKQGNWLIYHYRVGLQVSQIDVVSSDRKEHFGSVNFHYQSKYAANPSMIISVNNMTQFYYHYEQIGADYCLSYIEDRKGLRENYFYKEIQKKGREKQLILNKIEYPGKSATGFLWDTERLLVKSIWGFNHTNQFSEFAQFVYRKDGGEILFSDGTRQEYWYDKRGRLVQAKWGETKQKHTYDSNGCLVLTETADEEGRSLEKKMLYDEQLHLIQEEVAHGGQRVVRAFVYDHLNRVTDVFDCSGSIETFAYYKDTHLLGEHLKDGVLNKYEYDHSGLMTKYEQKDGSIVHKVHLFKRENFLLVEEKQGFHHPQSSDTEFVSTVRYLYDKHGNILQKDSIDRTKEVYCSQKYSYTKNNLIEKISHSMGRVTHFEYDHLYRVIGEIGSNLSIFYEYDCCGRVTKKIRRCASREDLVEEYQYDDFGRLVTKINEHGKKIRHSYDELGRMTEDETGSWKLDVFGKRVIFKDLMNRETHYTNGIFKEPCETIFPDKSVEKCIHLEFGRKKEFVNDHGVKTICLYDESGRLIEKSCGTRYCKNRYVGEKLVEVEENGVVVSCFIYDGFGRIEEENNLGHIKKYFYNHIGQLTSMIDDGLLIIYQRDSLSRVIKKWVGKSVFTYTYDENGEVVIWGRGEGEELISTHHVYDGFGDDCLEYDARGGKIQWHHKKGGRMKIDPLQRSEEEFFDKDRRVVRLNRKEGGVDKRFAYDAIGNLIYQKNDASNETREAFYQYDHRDRLIEVKDQYGVRQKKHNALGDIVWEKRESGVELFYEYNDYQELVSFASSDNSISYRYEYNDRGAVVKTVNEITGSVCQREYDEHGAMILEKLENGLVMRYQYKEGKKSVVTLPDESSIHYVYDQGSICRVYRLDKEHNFIYDHLVSFDSRGLPKREEMIGGLGTIERSYDRDLQLSKITTPFHYQTITEKDGACNVLKIRLDDRDVKIEVDALDQIITDVGCNGHYERQNGLNRDVGGRAVGVDDQSYTFDAVDRLVEVRKGNEVIAYTYDAFDRIVERKSNQKVQRFIYDEMIEIGSVSEKGTIKELRVLGYGKKGDIGKSVAIEIDGIIYAPLHDLFRNFIGIEDVKDIKVTNKLDSSIFGEETKIDGIVSPWRFQSKRIDEISGIVFFGFRVYLPQFGEFCQLDARGDGYEMNLTHFNYNNPLTHCDPWGLSSQRQSSVRCVVTFDNIFVSPDQPVAMWLINNLIDREKIFIPDTNDIKHYPGRENCNKDQAVVVVNGIRNKEKDCQILADRVAQGYSGKIVSIYNRSGGAWNDLTRVANEFARRDTAPVLNLRSALCDLHEQGYQNIHLINHSEGGLIAKRALEKLADEIRDKIHVVSIASPSVIPHCYAKTAVNYYSSIDRIDNIASFSYMIGLLRGHKVSYEYKQSKIVKYSEHSIHSPTYSMILDQVLESIENAS